MLIDRAYSVSIGSSDCELSTAALGTNNVLNSGDDATHLGIAVVVTEGWPSGSFVTVALSASCDYDGCYHDSVVCVVATTTCWSSAELSLVDITSNANALDWFRVETCGPEAICSGYWYCVELRSL